MLPGMVNLSGIVGRSPLVLPILTDWFSFYDASSDIILPVEPGYTVARVTCIARGGYGNNGPYDTDGDGNPDNSQYYGYSGPGGNCAASIISFSQTDSLAITMGGVAIGLKKNSSHVVLAYNADYGLSNEIGDIKFLGGGGAYGVAQYDAPYRVGGGAAGILGSPTSRTNAGNCLIWTRRSDGATARAGGGNENYGGGGDSYGSSPGQSLFVIEWGEKNLPS